MSNAIKSEQLSPNTIRLAIARRVIERKRQELGDHLIAGACYGSVAHNAAMANSDVELVILTDDTIPAKEEQFFDQGIMVECDMLPATRMLSAAQRVTSRWGIQADQYLYHLVIWDPDDFFPRLWAAANDLSTQDFATAQQQCWWWVYEVRCKMHNALLADNRPRIAHHGWEFAYAAAMHIALYERKPYESDRTLWQDVSARGYGMKELVEVITAGSPEKIPAAVDNVWEHIKTWGTPRE